VLTHHFWSSVLLFVLALYSCSSEPSPRIIHQRLLTISHEQPFLTLDPQTKNDNVTWSVLGNIYEPLIEFDPDMKTVGRLAERWENPNDVTWRFYLRKNVHFHNGKALDADDVVYTIERGLSPKGEGIKSYLISVTGAKRIDARTVDIITDHPNPVLLNRLTFVNIIPRSNNPQEEITRPIGTGPYTYVARRGSLRIILRSNTAYWNGRPQIDQVEFVSFTSDQTTVDSLIKGEVQIIRDFPEKLIPAVQSAKNCNLITHDGLAVTLLGFNLSGSAAKNPMIKAEVRKAIYYGLDSNELVADLGGLANNANQLVSPNVFGYDPGYIRPMPNIEIAKRLLKRAGYASGFSTDIYGVEQNRVNKIASELEKVGVHARPHLIQWKDLYEKILHHELPLYTISWQCSTGDASDFFDNCIHSANQKSGYGNFNIAAYNNAEVDRLIEQSEQTLKTNERKELLQKALLLVMSDLPYIPLYSRYNHYGVSKEISWRPRQDGRLYAFDVQWKPVE